MPAPALVSNSLTKKTLLSGSSSQHKSAFVDYAWQAPATLSHHQQGEATEWVLGSPCVTGPSLGDRKNSLGKDFPSTNEPAANPAIRPLSGWHLLSTLPSQTRKVQSSGLLGGHTKAVRRKNLQSFRPLQNFGSPANYETAEPYPSWMELGSVNSCPSSSSRIFE